MHGPTCMGVWATLICMLVLHGATRVMCMHGTHEMSLIHMRG